MLQLQSDWQKSIHKQPSANISMLFDLQNQLAHDANQVQLADIKTLTRYF